MTRLVHLVRHGRHAEVGNVLSGRSEIALSEEGRGEVKALARMLADERLASIHSSPRRRTIQTAQAVAAARGLEVRVAPALDEIEFGDFTGRAFADLGRDPDWQCWNRERATARCPGGETMDEAVARSSAYLAAITEQDTPALCVSHCDIIRGVVARLLGLSCERMFTFDCDPASLTTIAIDGEGWRLVSLNVPLR